jgi:hypothetical protein
MTNAAPGEDAIPCLHELQRRFDSLRADVTSQFAASASRKTALHCAAAKQKHAKYTSPGIPVERKHAAVERKPRSMPSLTLEP